MLNDFIGILLGCCMNFVPENYQEIVFAISTPIFVLSVEIFTFWLCAWFARAIYSFVAGRGETK